MIFIKIKTESEFKKLIQADTARGYYFFCGNEDFLIDKWSKHLTIKFQSVGGFNFVRIDGQSPDIDKIFDATQQLPVFADSKCVLVTNLDAKKLDTDALKKLEDCLLQLPEEILLVIVCRELDGRTSAGKKLPQLADKFGCAVLFQPLSESELGKFLIERAKQKSCELTPALAKEIIAYCGKDMINLTNELDKICAYSGGGVLTKNHLYAIATQTVEERIFNLSSSIISKNHRRALEILGNLFFLKESPVAVLAVLSMTFVDLYRAWAARSEGFSLQQALEFYNYKGKEFRMNNVYFSKLSPEVISDALDVLYKCDIQMKSSSASDELLLEQTVLKLLAMV